MIYLYKNAQKGFTLIEIIVTLVVAAILGSALFQYMGTALIQSSIPIKRLKQTMDLKRVMENITGDYLNPPLDLNALKNGIGVEGTTQNNSYGQYIVEKNRFIKFEADAETPLETGDPMDLLKVTIKSGLGEKLTVLFSSQ